MDLTYDENSKGVIQNENMLVLIRPVSGTDIVFKASFVVASDVICSGKIMAYFDLTVIGNISAVELEVKGRFICTGRCDIKNSINVHGEILINDINATSIETQESIVGQSIDIKRLSAAGNIIVGKILAVEELAKTDGKILCGETAYGAGKIIAQTVITGDPLDLDDGAKTIISPFEYDAEEVNSYEKNLKSMFQSGEKLLSETNDYKSYINALVENCMIDDEKRKLRRWCIDIERIEDAFNNGMENCRNIELLLWATEIVHSPYFENWHNLKLWYSSLSMLFYKLVRNDNPVATPLKSIENRQEIIHDLYGTGVVTNITYNTSGQLVTVEFASIGEKKFQLPKALHHFFKSDVSETTVSEVDYKSSIQCEFSDFEEWIRALHVLNIFGNTLDIQVFITASDLVTSNIGLRSTFFNNRLNEKGWSLIKKGEN